MRHSDDLAKLESFYAAATRIANAYAAQGEAADLRQDILMRLWQSRRLFKGRSAYSTWAYRVALNTAIDHIRRDQHRKTTLERVSLLESREASGQTDFALTREVQVIQDYVGTLNVEDRSLFALYLEGLEHARISDVLGISPGASRTRLSRLKDKFKQHLKGVDLEY